MTKSLKALVGTTAILAIACLYWGNWSFPTVESNGFRDALVAFALVGVLSEASYVRLRIGRSATHSSIVFIPFIASMLLFESGWAMLLACAVVAFAEQFIRQKTPAKVIFNVAQHGMSVWAGASIFRLLGGIPALSHDTAPIGGALVFPMQFLAIGGGVLAYFLFNITAVSVAVSLNDKTKLRAAWVRIGSSQLAYDLVSSPLGVLLALFYVRLGMVGVLATLVPLFFVRRAYRVTIELEEANRDLLELMVKAIEARDPYTSGHSQRVSQLAEMLAKELGLGSKLVEQVRTAALLHDVGKIHEEYAPLLRKEGKLDPAEKALMQTHSMRSADLVGTISAFRGAIVDAVRHHHENYDGTGYPSNLSGYAIPVGSRIIMIADTVDAMTTDRPYRKALSFERVASELAKFSGRQFDPHLVEVFMHSVAIRDLINQRVPGSQESEKSVTSWASTLPWRRTSRRAGLSPSA
jgi:putative nucleotidyltransferase with HDIG domain